MSCFFISCILLSSEPVLFLDSWRAFVKFLAEVYILFLRLEMNFPGHQLDVLVIPYNLLGLYHVVLLDLLLKVWLLGNLCLDCLFVFERLKCFLFTCVVH